MERFSFNRSTKIKTCKKEPQRQPGAAEVDGYTPSLLPIIKNFRFSPATRADVLFILPFCVKFCSKYPFTPTQPNLKCFARLLVATTLSFSLLNESVRVNTILSEPHRFVPVLTRFMNDLVIRKINDRSLCSSRTYIFHFPTYQSILISMFLLNQILFFLYLTKV